MLMLMLLVFVDRRGGEHACFRTPGWPRRGTLQHLEKGALALQRHMFFVTPKVNKGIALGTSCLEGLGDFRGQTIILLILVIITTAQ